MADLYLLYSEALNEAYGPSSEVYKWIDLVRERAGLEDVQNSWKKYAIPSRKSKPDTQDGLREIIQRERLIELANEGHRYWEIRRWKKAKEMWHNRLYWDGILNSRWTAEPYYRVKTIFTPQFTTKIFLPIKEYDLFLFKSEFRSESGW